MNICKVNEANIINHNQNNLLIISFLLFGDFTSLKSEWMFNRSERWKNLQGPLTSSNTGQSVAGWRKYSLDEGTASCGHRERETRRDKRFICILTIAPFVLSAACFNSSTDVSGATLLQVTRNHVSLSGQKTSLSQFTRTLNWSDFSLLPVTLPSTEAHMAGSTCFWRGGWLNSSLRPVVRINWVHLLSAASRACMAACQDDLLLLHCGTAGSVFGEENAPNAEASPRDRQSQWIFLLLKALNAHRNKTFVSTQRLRSF